jgi:lipopolysaccharide transport system permease protein
VVFSAMMPWQFFSNSIMAASLSLIGNANLISKVYFPRLIVPASAVVTSLADLFIAFVLLFLIMIWYRFLPSWHLIVLPGFILLAIGAALGPGLLLTALSVRYRDFRYVVPFVVQIGFFVSPVGYPSSAVPPQWRLLYSLNPMVGAIDGFRWSILGGQSALYLPGFLLSLAVTAIALGLGISYFRRTERSFADVI